jgi:hypothetical protein
MTCSRRCSRWDCGLHPPGDSGARERRLSYLRETDAGISRKEINPSSFNPKTAMLERKFTLAPGAQA